MDECFFFAYAHIRERLLVLADFAHLGEVFQSSAPVHLSKDEVDFVVQCIKYILTHHSLFQVNSID
jgi:hypothetical protein